MLQAARDAGLEGIVAKRLDSPYRPGVRDPSLAQGEELPHPIGRHRWVGRRSGEPRRRARRAPARECRVRGASTTSGRVGTGFSVAERTALRRRLSGIERPSVPFSAPFRRAEAAGVHWVEPEIVGEVRFSEWTRTGRLRQPVLAGPAPGPASRGGRR